MTENRRNTILHLLSLISRREHSHNQLDYEEKLTIEIHKLISSSGISWPEIDEVLSSQS